MISLNMSSVDVASSSEGRWPRICEQRSWRIASRVAMLSFHSSPLAIPGKSRDAGGMNVYVRELSSYLGRQGLSVDVFTRWTDPGLPQIIDLDAHARLIHVPAGPIAPRPKDELISYTDIFTDGVDYFSVAHRLNYDVIHSHYWLSALVGQKLTQRWDVPHLAMFHTLARLKKAARPEENEPDIRIAHEQFLLDHLDHIVVATDDERRQIADLYGVSHASIDTIPCGVDLDRFTPTGREEARVVLASQLGITATTPLIVFVGRLEPLKGANLLIDALAGMQTDAALVLVGGHASDPQRDVLAAQAASCGVSDRVHYVDAVSHDALPLYYRAADVLAIASHYESFGMTAVEAMACGTPVIAPAVGGLPFIVQSHTNGFLVAKRTPALFAHYLDKILSDRGLYERLSSLTRTSVLRFGWDKVAEAIACLYDEACLETIVLRR
jgi:D-inositol-3-phosphate glycosyltransferase